MDDPKYILQSLSLDPAPVVIGENCTVRTDLFYNETEGDTTAGTLSLSIYAPNMKNCSMDLIGSVAYNLCDVVASKCPIEAGTNFTSLFIMPDTTIPSNTSAGIYMINGEFKDQNQQTLGCISSLVQFEKQSKLNNG